MAAASIEIPQASPLGEKDRGNENEKTKNTLEGDINNEVFSCYDS